MSHKIFLACVLLAIGLFSSGSVSGDELRSFKSVNKNDFWIRHQNQVGVLTPITNEDGLGRSDATFWVVPGLTGACNSLQAVKPSGGFYFRHQNFRIVLAKFENSDQFRNDATFCIRSPGLTGGSGTVSFESVNFPQFFIRHSDFQLFLNQSDNSGQFSSDATFRWMTNLIQNNPIQSIDPGTNLVPAQ